MFEMNGDMDKKKKKKIKKKERLEGMKKEMDIVSKLYMWRCQELLYYYIIYIIVSGVHVQIFIDGYLYFSVFQIVQCILSLNNLFCVLCVWHNKS